MDYANLSHPLPLGTQVTVSDGTPRPPDRFKRKLTEWTYHNYTGVVVELFEHEASHRYVIQMKDSRGWQVARYMVVNKAGVPFEHTTPIAGACLAPLSGGQVDIDALLKLESDVAAAKEAGWHDCEDAEDPTLVVVANEDRPVHFTGPTAWADALAWDAENGHTTADRAAAA